MTQPSAGNKLFCFGVGYSALRLADRLVAAGWTVAGTCRTEEKRQALAERGIAAVAFERGHPIDDAATVLADTTHLLSSVPPDDAGDPVLDLHRSDIAAIAGLRWAGYLSTTGVYGDTAGAWVDEAAATHPTNTRSKRRLAAEQDWLGLGRAHGIPVHVFRLAGIYGPGRSVLDQARTGTARRVVKPGQAFSRIHVDDIAAVLEASMAHPDPGAVYNVCDDEPAPSADVVAYACALLGVAPPPEVPFEEADLSPMARSFYADNRRVRNGRIKQDLGVALRYPSYREGLRAIADEI